MVSKASDDLPEPDRPVMTTSRSLGRVRSMFFRLCCRAPRISILSSGIWVFRTGYRTGTSVPSGAARPVKYGRVSRRGGGLSWHLEPVQPRAVVPQDLALRRLAQPGKRQERVHTFR